MTLINIAQALAKNVGLAVPDIVVASSAREWVEVVEMANATCEEIARRVDWGALTTQVTLTGDGTPLRHDMGDLFSRVTRGASMVSTKVTRFVTAPPVSTRITVRPLSRPEWTALVPEAGTPRYFLLEGDEISLWPYLPDGDTLELSTQTKAWCSNGTDAWLADDETAAFDDELIKKGLIVRWRRQKGMDYSDYEAEYEASLANFAQFDDRSRI